jgi:DNA polymerase-3 subunit delta'
MSWEVAGQEHLVRGLARGLRDGELAHAYLIAGPTHSGKGTLALDLARAVNCTADAAQRPCGECRQCTRIASGKHADVVTLAVEEAEGRKQIRVEQVHEALHMASLQPFEGGWRVFIIDGAEALNDQSANALLKVLEEPPPQVLWLLLTVDEEQAPQTIRSRCQRLALRPLSPERIAAFLEQRWKADREQAALLGRLANGALGWAVKALQDPSALEARARTLDRIAALADATLEERFGYTGELAALIPRERTAAREVLDLWASWWRDVGLLITGAADGVWNLDRVEELRVRAGGYRLGEVAAFVSAILRCKEHLEMNVNPRLAFEHLMLQLPQRRGTALEAGAA